MKKYLQVYQKIKEDIINELYKRNAKLTSKRTLAEEMDVSLITVETAYDVLQSEGYIDARERSGYYVIYSTQDAFFIPKKAIFSRLRNTTTTAKASRLACLPKT